MNTVQSLLIELNARSKLYFTVDLILVQCVTIKIYMLCNKAECMFFYFT